MAHFHKSLSDLPPPPRPPPPQEPVPDVNRFYTLRPPPPPPPPVTECVQVPKDPMKMYAPRPRGYKVPKQHPYQIMETSITHQMRAMQASKLTPDQTTDTSSPSSSHHVMQSPMQASLHPMQAAQMQVPVQSMKVPMQSSIQPTQIPMQAPLQAMQMPIHALTQPPPPPLQPDMRRSPPVVVYANPKPGTSSSSTLWPQYEPYMNTAPSTTETTCASFENNYLSWVRYIMNENEKLQRENEELNRKMAEVELEDHLLFIYGTQLLDWLQNGRWTNEPGVQYERQRVLLEQLQKILATGKL